MKHYLDLIPISAEQHRKQTRMTRLCIVLAVFLVTVIFGMADMEMRSQYIQAEKTDGSWHAAFSLGEEQGELLRLRPEISSVARYGSLNYHLDDGYQIKGTETGICAFDPAFQDMIPDAQVTEGTFPQTAGEIAINEIARNRLSVQIGDTIVLITPQGDTKQYRITGIAKNTALTAKLDAFCVFLSTSGFQDLHTEETQADQETLYFVKFKKFCNIRRALNEISAQFSLSPGQVRQNVKVLTLMLQSRDPYMIQFYFVAAMLAVLVVIAGIFMITASMNSNIARRTTFFGMMRCLGATKTQVIRFVRQEALRWCKTAIPAGVLAGVVVVWALCAMLRFFSPGLFEGLPVFGVSFPGILAGILVGLITVLLAAGAPAKRASNVSPLTAVSGNAGTIHAVKRAANTSFFHVDVALGIHHAMGSRKNFFLVTGSFAFSIILFLSFSTIIDFMHHAVTPLRPSAPDLCLYRKDSSNRIPPELADEIRMHPGVKRAFGRAYAELTLAEDNKPVIVLSYDTQQFQWAEKTLLSGNLPDVADGKSALCVFREGIPFAAGSSITLIAGGKEHEISISGTLGDVPYSYGPDQNTGTLTDMIICPENLFRTLTEETGYAVLDIQLDSHVTDAQVQELRQTMEQACQTDVSFSDRRITNQEAKGANYSMSVFLYGFLTVIALIGFFNIINNIAMSVSARMREYGAMRAIGMSVRQLTRMVIGEAMTYTVSGVIIGCAIGLPLNRSIFQSLVTARWGDVWRIPGRELFIIIVIMLASMCLAVLGPAKQIKTMTIIDNISRE